MKPKPNYKKRLQMYVSQSGLFPCLFFRFSPLPIILHAPTPVPTPTSDPSLPGHYNIVYIFFIKL